MRDRESFERRLNAAHALLVQKGLVRGKRNYSLIRLLWSMGIGIRLPLFASFRANFLIWSSLFAVCWGGATWMFSAQGEGQSILGVLLWSGIVGTLSGSVMAMHCRRLAQKHDLPDWDDLPGVAEVFD